MSVKHAEKEPIKMASKPNKKMKKEGIEGAIDTVYAVQKPYSGCQLTSLIKPIDPLVGLGGSEIMPDQVHAVYPDQEMAQRVAETLYKEFEIQEQQLEEKKMKVVDAIKKKIDEMEKLRKENVDMIKENPGNVTEYKQKVAELATKIDELVNTLERVEKSKKQLDKKEEKKKVEEALANELKKSLNETTHLLKKSKLSSKEYQDAKKLKGFKKEDWKWNKEEDLYIKK